MSHGGSEIWTMGHAINLAEVFASEGIAFPQSAVALVPYMDVVLWAQRQHRPASVEDLCARWGVSRATGYRWHAWLYGGLEKVGQRSEKGPRRGAPTPPGQAVAP